MCDLSAETKKLKQKRVILKVLVGEKSDFEEGVIVEDRACG